MANEEAIKIIKQDALAEWQRVSDVDEAYWKSKVYVDAYMMAIKALEKQIPRKPLKEKYFTHYSWERKCPECGDWVILNSGTRMKYCCNCGQAIDWSE